ncbi:NAD-dependent epimerase/dehydratase family protein [Fibrobacterota bacterium]
MILITGGAGVLGRRITAALAKKGNNIRVLTLPGDPKADSLVSLGAEVCFGDITRPRTLEGILEGVDTVIHLAAVILSPARPGIFREVNLDGTRNILSLCEQSSIKHFIYISSASVTYRKSNAYSRSKHAAEEMVKQLKIPHFTIVRPTLVYEDGGAEEFWKFVLYLKKFPVVPFIGKGTALKSPVHADDIVQGLVKIPGNPVCCGKTYNFSGGEELPIKEMARRLLRHMGRDKFIIPVPVWICRLLSVIATLKARIFKRDTQLTWQTITGLIQNANLDHSEARDDIGYNPRPFSKGIEDLKSLKGSLKKR